MADHSTANYTVLHLPNEILGISLSFLGVGHFRFIPLVCNRFKTVYLTEVSDEKITRAESYTSSIQCAEEYLREAGSNTQQIAIFWYNVARYGRLQVLELADQRGHSRIWNESFCGWKTYGADICRKAAEYGQLDALQILRRSGCSWNIQTCEAAAGGGHLSVLQWVRRNGCHWDTRTCQAAAGGGHLSVLQWARHNGCHWDGYTCWAAAGGGHLSILQWARQNGCNWDSRTCIAAAGGGHLSVLQWARRNECDWDEGTCIAAAQGGHLSVLQWAIQNGCNCDWHSG